MEHGIHVWDIAAGKIIVEEAGGIVTDPLGIYTVNCGSAAYRGRLTQIV